MTTGKLAGAAAFQPRAPISVAWGPTGWSVAISRAASACRSSQGISKSWNGVTADPLSTGTAQRRSYRGIVPQQLNTLQTVALLEQLRERRRLQRREPQLEFVAVERYGQAARLISTS